MSDLVFSGHDVAAAVAAAEAALGISPGQLKYVVLQEAQPGGRGLTAQPARIAVLRTPGAPRAAAEPAAPPAARPADPASGIRDLVRRIAEASGADLSAEVEDTPDALVVRVVGPGHDLLLEEEGDVLRALEYLLQLTYRRAIEPRRLVVECEGFRAQRDESLKAEALRIAALVAADGKPRTTGVLNSYERRIVHMALTDHPQLETFSVGTEGGRRVTIAPRGTRGPGAEG